MITDERVTALITLYYPKQEHVCNIRLIAKQCNRVILLDNSPTNHESMFRDLEGVVYVFFNQNEGLSGAFNIALMDKQFNWKEEDFVIFFDQDTAIPNRHIQKLRMEYQALEQQGENIGCLGPVYYNTNSGEEELPRHRKMVREETARVSAIITTSMLTRYGSLKKIGYWSSKIFLDYADWELCWRLSKSHLKIYITRTSVIHHTVGEKNSKIGPIKFYVGQPVREYYQARDAIYLIFLPQTPLTKRIRFFLRVCSRPFLYLCYYGDKLNRMKFYLKGIIDAVKGRCGCVA